VLSHVLFCILFDELYMPWCQLNMAAIGPIDFCFVSVLADDLVLLAPSQNATRNMLKICDEFGKRLRSTECTGGSPLVDSCTVFTC